MPARPQPPRTVVPMEFTPGQSVQFDVDAFDDLVLAHGAELVHWRAMRNPAGMVDQHDSRRPGEDDVGASNAMVYTQAGCFTGAILGNTKDLRAVTGNVLDAATAQLVCPRFYDCSPNEQPERIYLMPLDRLYLRQESVLVPVQHYQTVHPTLTDRLRFPAVKVHDLMDADGARYTCCVDFNVVDGCVVWVPGRAPVPDPVGGPGKVYTIRYLYRPFWYVERLMHEIRIAQSEDELGNRTVEEMPQSAIVQREYVFRNEDQKAGESAKPDSPRQAPAAADGGFGAR